VGLAIVGSAPTMDVLVLGRLVQGLGAGGLTVALYVIVARVYPSALQVRIFAAFSAAWVVPSLIGPLIAGLVAEHFGWRWVFLGVIVLVILAMGMVVPAMRTLAGGGGATVAPWNIPRIAWSVLAAVAVLVVNVSASVNGPLRWVIPPIAIAVVVIALRPLLPQGTLLARHGLPSVVLVRVLIAGAFFAAEIYVPYLLTRHYAFTAAGAGLALTAAGLTWAAGSWLQSRLEPRLSGAASFRIGTALLTLSIASALLTAAFTLAPGTMIVGWALAGAGMGFMYPRTSVMMLGYSTVRDQGFNSAGLAIADSIGAALAIAATALVFTVLTPVGRAVPFAGCFALTTALAAVAFCVSHRVDAGVGPALRVRAAGDS
jgi:MFS family permease